MSSTHFTGKSWANIHSKNWINAKNLIPVANPLSLVGDNLTSDYFS